MIAPLGPREILLGVLVAALVLLVGRWVRRRISLRVSAMPVLGDMLVPDDDPEAEWFKAVQERTEANRRANRAKESE